MAQQFGPVMLFMLRPSRSTMGRFSDPETLADDGTTHDRVTDEAALQSVDLLFGCVDNDGPRLLLNRFAVSNSIPYFDVASGIYPTEDGYAAGGRLGRWRQPLG